VAQIAGFVTLWPRVRRRSEKEENMPVHRGKDGKGPFYQWGDSGKKHHYAANDKKSRDTARRKAERQGKAIRASGYRG